MFNFATTTLSCLWSFPCVLFVFLAVSFPLASAPDPSGSPVTTALSQAAVRPLPSPTATTSSGATAGEDALDQVAREYLRDGAVATYELSDGLAYPQ